VDSETISRLIDLNHQFYQTFAQRFSSTRQRLQPGVLRIIEEIPNDANILDLGCGNGELWLTLNRRGYHGIYVGIDFSKEMLEIAYRRCHIRIEDVTTKKRGMNQTHFMYADLSSWDWYKKIPQESFDFIFAFAVLHHLPGHDLQLKTIAQARKLLAPGGRFVHSEWQFLNSPRLRKRIQDWEEIGLSKDQVEEGDYLLDWRNGGFGLRYVHHFCDVELKSLARESGFQISQTFHSDGKGGELSLYQIWKEIVIELAELDH